ncbi:unnamed protein product [Toxocara canis]|uniref:Transmembrane protein n=1 Tax=Toxocara canis TaxID=6265 RepID=A0A183TX26_TOXCA|nr:unnamed protein product [Toxocara canis]
MTNQIHDNFVNTLLKTTHRRCKAAFPRRPAKESSAIRVSNTNNEYGGTIPIPADHFRSQHGYRLLKPEKAQGNSPQAHVLAQYFARLNPCYLLVTSVSVSVHGTAFASSDTGVGINTTTMADMVTVDGTMDMTDIWTGEWVAILAAVLTTTMVAQPLILCFFYVSPGERARREGAICAAKQHDYYHAQVIQLKQTFASIRILSQP